jgi:hypothetical protein
VRRLAPECLGEHASLSCKDGSNAWRTEVSRLALGMAMVLATNAKRLFAGGWVVGIAGPDGTLTHHESMDRDHGGDWLLSLHAAFIWSRGGAA